MNMIRIFERFSRKSERALSLHLSYSQCGEDAIVDFLLKWIGIDQMSYLDLGANDPITFSNTYRFYRSGFSGVLVEADSDLAAKIRKVRPRDICLAKAVSVTSDDTVEFFKMSADTLSTIQSSTVERYERDSEHRLATRNRVAAIHINKLLEIHFAGKSPDFVSLDVEGLDVELLRAWDFCRWRPAIFCVETLTYTQNQSAVKVEEIFELMDKADYQLYADTYINSIFVERSAWGRRR
jgi:FkbM family methyltransferase